MNIRSGLFLGILAASGSAIADPFDNCPESGFLVQGRQASVYGVDLSTGFYRVHKDVVPTKNKVNGLGFSIHDNYLYGWDYASGTLARLNSDFDVIPLTLAGKPNTNFFVGDVSLVDKKYYMYKRGSKFGLYEVDISAIESLDEVAAQGVELPVRQIIDGAALNLRIFDIAFHPDKKVAYSVDSTGRLIELNVETGEATPKDGVAEKGTYGAVYFDSAANLFISRNQDGKIFKIAVDDANPTAEEFAQGPKSGINDGARCARGEEVIKVVPEYDFGDAPAGYSSYLEDNGARHKVAGNLRLGALSDAEPDAYVYPLSDDATGDQPQGSKLNDDDDGIEFLTPFIPGQFAIFKVNVSETGGFFNGWFDWNQDDSFSAGEALSAQPVELTQTSTLMSVFVPNDAPPSNPVSPETWGRFRVASASNEVALPSGEASSGEVEDYPIMVDKLEEEEVRYYPSKTGFSTLVYEDNWPLQGDYDLNDLTVYFRSALGYADDKITRLELEGEFVSIGAAFHSGFAVRLPGVNKSLVKGEPKLFINDIEQTGVEILESDERMTDVSLVISHDLLDLISWDSDECSFYRTEKKDACALPVSNQYKLHIEFNEPIDADAFPEPPFDPFMFATENKPRNPYVIALDDDGNAIKNEDGSDKYVADTVFSEAPGRGLEIHLKGKGFTPLFNSDLVNVKGSVANKGNDPFITENGMPWAMEFNTEWSYPSEFKDVIYVYYKFRSFITSAGELDRDWYILRDNPSFDDNNDPESQRFINANAASLYDY